MYLNINTELTQWNKTENASSSIRIIFHSLAANYHDHNFIYTDASKTNNTVGGAVITPDTVLKFRLNPASSVFSGELFAILRAIKYVTDNNRQKWVICSDSLSSLQAIQDSHSANPMVLLIREEYLLTTSQAKTVTFMFIPSHVGIDGNENADKNAKDALTSNSSEIIDLISPLDAKRFFSQHIENIWDGYWRQVGGLLQMIKSSPFGTISLPLSRTEQVISTRVLLEHTKLTHGYLLSREEPPVCNTCCQQLTIRHIIIDCKKFQHERQAFLGHQPLNVLKTDHNALTRFLNETGLFSKL